MVQRLQAAPPRIKLFLALNACDQKIQHVNDKDAWPCCLALATLVPEGCKGLAESYWRRREILSAVDDPKISVFDPPPLLLVLPINIRAGRR